MNSTGAPRRSPRLAAMRSRSVSPMRAKAPRRRSLSAGNERSRAFHATPRRQKQETRASRDKRAVEAGITALRIDEGPVTEVFVDEDLRQADSEQHTTAENLSGALKGENRARSALSKLQVDDNAPRPSPGKRMRKQIAQGHQQLRQERRKNAKAKHILQTEGIRVFDRVFLGGKRAAANGDKMMERNVRAVVNVTRDIKCYFEEESLDEETPSQLQYLRIRVDDEQEELIHQFFDKAADFIADQLEAAPASDDGTPPAVFIHCQMGQSRSPSIVLAYAMKKLGWSLRAAYRYLSVLHANLKINDGFKRQLMQYELETFGVVTLDFFDRKKRRKQVDYSAEKTFDSRVTFVGSPHLSVVR